MLCVLGEKCVLQKQLAQSPGHLSTIANITPHRVTGLTPRPRPAPALAPPTQLLHITLTAMLEYLPNILTQAE